MSAYFVTGTDTEIGKTFVTCALLRLLARKGIRAVGMKPVAAGLDDQGHNEDVEQILAAAPVVAPRELVNPYAFKSPMAPHAAAAEEGRDIRFAPIHQALSQLKEMADVVVVEGVGGFCVPLGPEGDCADLAQTLGLPVILVVGLRLGCINHAILTAEAIRARGLPLVGWVANQVDGAMRNPEGSIAALEERLAAPLLGVIPRLGIPDAEQAADCLRLPRG
ncbi:MAG TPA: dethiobiotin synthase [Rhodocyclaceae bacterium]|nr:dethiobiotin synthase [Rhodocyclaceae bacterium]